MSLEEIISLITSLYYKKQFSEAKALLSKAFELAKKADQSSEDFRRDLTQLYNVTGKILGELGEDKESLNFYECFQCLKMQLNPNISTDSQPLEAIKLYQFRKFSDYTLANLLNKELTLSKPTVMNDIADSLINIWLTSPSFGATTQNKRHLDPYKESFRDYRIASFCENNPQKKQYAVQNTLMWSHYADEHRGFCIEYLFHHDDFRKDDFSNNSASRLFRMNYCDSDDHPIDFEKVSRLSTSLAFLTKYKEWSYENEVRLLQYKPRQGALREQYKLSANTKISAIYFGYRCPKIHIQIIKKLLKDSDVKFYKMEIDYSNVYKLKYTELLDS